MNDELRKRLNTLRKFLRSEPKAPLIGNIEEGLNDPSSGVQFWNDFLEVCDGARFGSVDIFSNKNLGTNQFRLVDIPKKYGDCLIVGQVLYQPVFLTKETLDLAILEDDGEQKLLGSADQAILDYFLGKRYITLAPSLELDEWWEFIERVS